MLIAHRGGSGLKPENTLAAFLDADSLWKADMIEMDVHATADGHCVVIHDPTVEEVFAALPDMPFTIELKTAAAQVPLFRAITEYRATDRVILAGERNAYRTMFGSYRGPISASLEQALPFFLMHRMWISAFSWLNSDVVQMPEVYKGRRMLTPRFVTDIHARGVRVQVWTVNEVDDMERLLDWGVDGLITDYPDRLARVLNKRVNRPLPPGA